MALEFFADEVVRQSVPPAGPKILPSLYEFRSLLEFVMKNHGKVYDAPKSGSLSAESRRPASVAKEFALRNGAQVAIRKRMIAPYELMTKGQREDFSRIVNDGSEQWEVWLSNPVITPSKNGFLLPVQLLALSLGIDQISQSEKSDIHLSVVTHRSGGAIARGQVSVGRVSVIQGRLDQDLTSRSALKAMRLVRRHILDCLPALTEAAAIVG